MVQVQPQRSRAHRELKESPQAGMLGVILLLAACAMAAWPVGLAAAQGSASAREHFGNGVEHFDAEDYEGALAAFRDAYRLQPHPTVLVNIANCYLFLDRPVEAASFFRRYLMETGDGITDRQRREIEDALERAEAAQSSLVVVAAPGVEIFVDGGRVGVSPVQAPIPLNPGPHIVEFSDPSGAVDRQRVHTAAGASVRVEQHPPIGAESVADSSNSDTPEPGLDDRSGGGRVLAWVSGGIAVSAAVTGAIFGFTALNQRDEFEDTVRHLQGLPPSDPNVAILRANGRSISESRQTNALVADMLFATALISAGISVYGFLRDGSPAPAATQIEAAASDGGAVIYVSGGF